MQTTGQTLLYGCINVNAADIIAARRIRDDTKEVVLLTASDNHITIPVFRKIFLFDI